MPERDGLEGLRVTFLAGGLGVGGAERQLYYILRTLRAHGARPSLLTLSRGDHWEAPIRSLGVPVTWVGASPSRAGRLRAVWQAVRDDRPHVLQSHSFYTNAYAAAVARWFGVPGIGALRNDVYSEVRRLGRGLGTICLRGPQRLAANSDRALANARTLGVPAGRLHLLRNIVDTDYFTPPAAHDESGGPARNGQAAVRLLSAGRLTRQKRMDLFVEAVARLGQRLQRPVEAVIAGGRHPREDLLPELKRQAAALGLSEETLRFVGEVPDLRLHYRAADVFVLASDWEGTPNVVMEAMASGLPVVASAVGDVPGLVVDGVTGFLTAPGDVAALADRLTSLLHDDGLRRTMSRAARDRMVNRFGTTTLYASLHELYVNALA